MHPKYVWVEVVYSVVGEQSPVIAKGASFGLVPAKPGLKKIQRIFFSKEQKQRRCDNEAMRL